VIPVISAFCMIGCLVSGEFGSTIRQVLTDQANPDAT